jgi:hypothetical protein
MTRSTRLSSVKRCSSRTFPIHALGSALVAAPAEVVEEPGGVPATLAGPRIARRSVEWSVPFLDFVSEK